MSNRKSSDNLEALFGKRFNDVVEVNKKESWNQPSDTVWENIQVVLHPKKNRNKLIVLLPWVSVAASSLLLVGCFQFYQYNHPSSLQLSYHKSKIEIAKEFVLSTFNGTTTVQEKRSDTPVQERRRKDKVSTSSLTNLVAAKQFDNNSKNSHHIEVSLSSKEENYITKIKATQTSKIVARLVNPLPETQRKIAINTPITPTIKSKPFLYLAANYTPLRKENTGNTESFKATTNISGSEHSINNNSAGLTFGVQFDKGWAVESGVRYNHTNKRIAFAGSIPPEQIEVIQNNQGVATHATTLKLGTPSSLIETDLVLSKNSVPMTDNETDLDITLSKSIRSLDIPLLVKKRWAVGNLGLSIKAGILNRFILQNKYDAPQVTFKNQQFKVSSSSVKEVSEGHPTTYTGHLVAGVGIDYTILPRLSLYVEPTFTRSLPPKTNLELATAYTQGKMVDVGIRYDLK